MLVGFGLFSAFLGRFSSFLVRFWSVYRPIFSVFGGFCSVFGLFLVALLRVLGLQRHKKMPGDRWTTGHLIEGGGLV